MRPLETVFVGLPWLGAALFQVTLLAGAALLAWWAVRRRSPALRAAVLVAALAGILLVPVLGALSPVWLPVAATVPASVSANEEVSEPLPDERPAVPELAFAAEREPFRPVLNEVTEQFRPAPTRPPQKAQAAPAPPVAAPARAAPAAAPWTLSHVLAGVWLVGAVGFLLRALLRLAALYTCRRRAWPVRDAEWTTALQSLAKECGVRSSIELRESPAIGSPLTLGLWWPVILLPLSRRSWSAEQRDLILTHELAHVRRRDYAAGLLAELAGCLYWFHPLVRWLAGRLRLEQEYAADAWVVSAKASTPYICCLAELALAMDRGHAALAPTMWRRRPEVLRRIDMLRRDTGERTRNPRRVSAWPVISLTVAACVAVAGVGYLHPAGDAAAQGPRKITIKLPGKQPDAKILNAPAVDLYGDPLPPGALARLGTVRFRDGGTSIAYSHDGKLLAIGGTDNRIRLLDAATGKLIRRLTGHQARTFSPPPDKKSAFDLLVGSVGKGGVTTLAFAADGKTLASGGWDDMVRLWDVATGKELHKIDAHRAMVARVAFSPDGKVLASRGGLDGVLRLWDPATGAQLHKVEGLSRVNPWRFYREAALAFSPDSKTVAVSDRKGIALHDVASGKQRRRIDGYRDCMYLAYSHDGKLLASGGLDDVKKEQYSLRLWDAATGQEVRSCELPKNEPPTCFAFSPDGNTLAAAVAETDTFTFDVKTGKVVHRLPHYWAYRLAYAPDGKTVVTIRGATVRNWDAATGKERYLEFTGHQGAVSAVAVSPDGKLIASGGEDVRLWDPATKKQVRRIAAPGTALAFSPDGKQLATVGRGGRVLHAWETASGKEVFKLTGPRLLRAVAWSPDGKYLASGDEQATVRIYEIANRKQLHEIDLKSGAESLSLAFSPDSKTLACGGGWNEGGVPPGITINLQKRVTITGKKGFLVLLWDVASGKEVQRLAGLNDSVKAVAFAPDGKTVAATSRDGRIALWEAATGKERLHIVAHPEHAESPFACTPCLAFSPDGTKLASGSTDKTIRLWDTVTAKELGRFQGDGGCLALAFGQGGRTLISGSADTTVTVWDMLNPVRGQKRPNVILIR